MSIQPYPKGTRSKLSANFTSSEFDCKCDADCETKIDEELVKKLQILRDNCGSSVRITAGYRCSSYQENLRQRGYETAKGISTHELGQAADIQVNGKTGKELEEEAEKAGFEAVGVAKNWVHVDLRKGKRRRWTYGS